MVKSQVYALAVLVLSASACAVAPTATTGTPEHGSSDCYQPPWYPEHPSAGVQASICPDGRTYSFVLGTGEPGNGAEATFLTAHRTELHAIDGIVGSGFGSCCNDPKASDPSCMHLVLRLCSTPLPELIGKLRELQANDEQFAKRALRVSVELQGLTGPRCEKDASSCGPVPYEDNNPTTPSAPENRTLVLASAFDDQPCTYDGECIKNGCGNECDHWREGDRLGTCPLRSELQGTFCGCVENQCAWFL